MTIQSPIELECSQIIPKSASLICAEIANLDRWPEFEGYVFLPGIQSATFEKHTEDMIGTRIRVLNKDGSTHVEEIYAWEVGQFNSHAKQIRRIIEETN